MRLDVDKKIKKKIRNRKEQASLSMLRIGIWGIDEIKIKCPIKSI